METRDILPAPESSAASPPEEWPLIPPDHRSAATAILILLTLSLCVTCCPCYGIPSFAGMAVVAVGLVQSAQIRQRYEKGDYAGALKLSNEVRNWLVCGIITPFALTLMFVIAALALKVAVELFNQYSNKN
jgi:hypothetical protein